MDFYLGGDVGALRWGVPVIVNYGRLRVRKTLPVATAPWVLDSRGYTELNQHGRWTISPWLYAADVRRFAREVGQLVWAAPQDWVCTPEVLAKTGLTEAEHQQRTVESVLLLRHLVPGVRIVPVLQGATVQGYMRHAALYAAHGIDLAAEPTVGVGSIAAVQETQYAHAVVSTLAGLGLHLHGFGVALEGLASYGTRLSSADSNAWSAAARSEEGTEPGCVHGVVKWERNCPVYAAEWREKVLAQVGARVHQQEALDLFSAA